MHALLAARLVAPLFSVLALHGVILSGHLDLAPGALSVGFAMVGLVSVFERPFRRATSIAALSGFAVLMLFQVMAFRVEPGLAMVVAVPPVVLHSWLAWLFGRTLIGGREPLIRRFSRLGRGEIPAELRAYTRHLTVVWTVLMAVFAVAAAVCAIAVPPKVWSWIVNIGMPLGSAALFLGEHGYRAVRYRHLGNNSPLKTLKMLLQPHKWMAP